MTAIVDWSREEVNEAAGHLQSINLDVPIWEPTEYHKNNRKGFSMQEKRKFRNLIENFADVMRKCQCNLIKNVEWSLHGIVRGEH